MRLNKEIVRLTECAKQVEFPGYNTAFQRFTHALTELIRENFGYDAAKGLIYDESSKTYSWSIEYSAGHFKNGGGGLTLRRYYEIDPAKPLDAEFQRVKEEMTETLERANEVMRAIIKLGGDV